MGKKFEISKELAKKRDSSERAAAMVMEDPRNLDEILSGVSSENLRIKFRSAKILRIISEKDPNLIYPRMDFFVDLLGSDNKILKWNAMDVIANLAAVDAKNRFDGIFGKFYGLLRDGELITAAHVVEGSGRIAAAKPRLRGKITAELLGVEKVPLPTEECRNILLGKTILAFDGYWDDIRDKGAVVSFVRKQLSNSRRSTRARAEKFLKARAKS